MGLRHFIWKRFNKPTHSTVNTFVGNRMKEPLGTFLNHKDVGMRLNRARELIEEHLEDAAHGIKDVDGKHDVHNSPFFSSWHPPEMRKKVDTFLKELKEDPISLSKFLSELRKN